MLHHNSKHGVLAEIFLYILMAKLLQQLTALCN